MSIHNNKPIAFAYYKNDRLIGYRQDTIGTIGLHPKIYHYSTEQVEICLRNIRENVTSERGFGKALIEALGNQREFSMIANVERKIHNTLQEAKAFEVRVVEAPEYEKEFNVKTAQYEIIPWGGYPHEAVKNWLQEPEKHIVLETHYFTLDGQVNLQ